MTYLTFPRLGSVGRLANQLWQIASTIGMARQFGMDPLFPPDWAYRRVYSIPDEMFGTEQGIISSDLATDLEPSERPFLQDRALWEDVEDEVLRLFQPSAWAEKILAREKAFMALKSPVLSVHVRRGDLVRENWTVPDTNLYHPLRPLSYYNDAIEDLGGISASIAVFGEDPAWNRENIPADWYSYHAPDNPDVDWIDLFLMSRCARHILSNSTYGVWGVYLSNDKEPIYPENWYGPKVVADNHAMVLPTWREFPCELESP